MSKIKFLISLGNLIRTGAVKNIKQAMDFAKQQFGKIDQSFVDDIVNVFKKEGKTKKGDVVPIKKKIPIRKDQIDDIESAIKADEGIVAADAAKEIVKKRTDDIAKGDPTGEVGEGIEGLETSINKIKKAADEMKELSKKTTPESIFKDFVQGQSKMRDLRREGQVRTAVRWFMRQEEEAGRLTLKANDSKALREYSGIAEEYDPINIFRRYYGENALEAADDVADVFNQGESFDHYGQLLRENVDPKILTPKTKGLGEYDQSVIDAERIAKKAEQDAKNLEILEEFDPKNRDPNADGGIIGNLRLNRKNFQYGTSKKSLDEIVGNVIGEREPPQLREGVTGAMAGLGLQNRMAAPTGIKNISSGVIKETASNVLKKMLYVAKNSEKKKQTSIYSALDGAIELAITNNATGVETDIANKLIAGKLDINEGVPTRIDENTVFDIALQTYDMLPNDLKAEINASTNLAKDESWSALLEGTNLGIAYNSDNQKIEGYYDVNIDSETYLPTKITPKFEKNNITNENISSLFIGQGDFPPQRSDFPEGQMGSRMFAESLQAWENNESKKYWGIDLKSKPTSDYKGIRGTFTTENVSGWSAIERGDDTDVTETQITGTIPNYLLKDSEPIEISGGYYQDLDTDDKEKKWRVDVPFPMGITPYYGKTTGDWENTTEYGINLDKTGTIKNWDYNVIGNIDQDKDYKIAADLTTELWGGDVGAQGFYDADGNWNIGIGAKWQLGEPDEKKYNIIQPSQIENHVWINGELVFMPENQQFEYKMSQDDNTIRTGNTLEEGWDILNYAQDYGKKPARLPPLDLADGGLVNILKIK